jgi:aconitate hydratase
MTLDSFGTRTALRVGDATYTIHRLDALDGVDVARLPYSLRILLENVLRNEDGASVRSSDVEAIRDWDPGAAPSEEIAFSPARVLLQDFTGVPAVVDLAAMRDAMADLGGDPAAIEPQVPSDLVIDHSIIAEAYGMPDSFFRNAEIEFERNRERYQFLRWGQQAFERLRVVPPNTGIVHQVNLEYLARVVWTNEAGEAYPDTLVGTDSHTPMVNGLGVLGWGVGGIEAEAAMLGQPISMLVPQVVGFELTGELREGATATDLVLTVTELLREHGVVGKFVEFFGPGIANVPLANRATIGNMSPEYGSTVAIFPVDDETLRYLELTGRPRELIALVEAYAKEQGLFHDLDSPTPEYSQTVTLDLGEVEPSLAGPTRPQDRVPLVSAKSSFRASLAELLGDGEVEIDPRSVDESIAESFPASDPPAYEPGDPDPADAPADPAARRRDRVHRPVAVRFDDGSEFEVDHGHVVIAAITSCTNTSNPAVMVAAALLARNAVERGLETKPWVKTSLAPGSKVVMDYYERSGLLPYLEKLRFNLVGYGCTTCIGNSGPLRREISDAVTGNDLTVAAVLSGNRNFEGRIHPEVKMNYLASPPLVVAYALAGTMDIDLYEEPIGKDKDGEPVFLRDIWPTTREITSVVADAVRTDQFDDTYAEVFTGDENWDSLETPEGDRFVWDEESTYVRRPPFFEGMGPDPEEPRDIVGARVLALLGDSVTTDHISPAGAIKIDSPAGEYLLSHDVEPRVFNSYGSRRGNHEVMIRGTFANVRLRNQLVPGVEGGVTQHIPSGETMTIFEAAMRYAEEDRPLVVLAGKEYGSGSSRDWAAKGPALQGVRAAIAESYERIHRSNLIGMGVLPLQFEDGDTVAGLGLSGLEEFSVTGVAEALEQPGRGRVLVRADDTEFHARLRIDTPQEVEYYRHGGILQYVLRRLLRQGS